MTKMQTAAEAARDNLAKAEAYHLTMVEACEDAQYRERNARELLTEAKDALRRAIAAEAKEAG
jgi:hypothetical protein